MNIDLYTRLLILKWERITTKLKTYLFRSFKEIIQLFLNQIMNQGTRERQKRYGGDDELVIVVFIEKFSKVAQRKGGYC